MFEFINDDNLRKILNRDYLELEILVANKATKSILIISGSLIEAVLVDYFLNNPPDKYNDDKIFQLNLSELIDLAVENKLISQRTKELSTVIRNYRNLIHPGREIRKNESFDIETSNVAYNLLKIIVSEIRENYLKLYGYNSKDILQKIEHDQLSITIFDKLVEKLKNPERIKLFKEIIKYEGHIENRNEYVSLLKSLIPKEELRMQLLKLLKIVETGDKSDALYYFDLLCQDLDLLSGTEIDTVVTYVLSYLEQEFDLDELQRFSKNRTFTSIGKYLLCQKSKYLFQRIMLSYFTYKNENPILNSLFYQMKNGLDVSSWKELERYFETESNSENYIPFDMIYGHNSDLPF
ncbi:MAG: hypothetical protein WC854_08675 [Bacteroidales bacterium]